MEDINIKEIVQALEENETAEINGIEWTIANDKTFKLA